MSATATTPTTQNIKRTDCWLMTVPFKCLKGQFTPKSDIQVPLLRVVHVIRPNCLGVCLRIDCSDDCRLSDTMRLKRYVKEKLNSSVSIHQSWFKISGFTYGQLTNDWPRPTSSIFPITGVSDFSVRQSIKYELNLRPWRSFLSHNVLPTTLSDWPHGKATR